MFKIVREKKYRAPSFKVDEECLDEFGRICVSSVLGNIKDQRQEDGSPLKRNAPSTLEEKRALGLPLLSLVWIGHRLVKGGSKSFEYKTNVNKQLVTIVPSTVQVTAHHPKVGKSTASPAELTEWVQRKGYVGWFGVNDKGREALRFALRKFLQRTINKARGNG